MWYTNDILQFTIYQSIQQGHKYLDTALEYTDRILSDTQNQVCIKNTFDYTF